MKGPSAKFLLIGTLTVFLISSMFFGSVFAQGTFTAVQLRGTVQDASQAGVPNATVTATNDATGVSVAATTDDQGRYTFNALHVGTYTLKVEVAGFKTVLRPNIVLRVGQQTDLDFTLEVGEVTSTIEVTAAAPLLDSVTGTLGAVVDNKYVTAVPLFDREISRLSYLAPGITQTQGQAFSNNAGGLNSGLGSQSQKFSKEPVNLSLLADLDGLGNFRSRDSFSLCDLDGSQPGSEQVIPGSVLRLRRISQISSLDHLVFFQFNLSADLYL